MGSVVGSWMCTGAGRAWKEEVRTGVPLGRLCPPRWSMRVAGGCDALKGAVHAAGVRVHVARVGRDGRVQAALQNQQARREDLTPSVRPYTITYPAKVGAFWPGVPQLNG